MPAIISTIIMKNIHPAPSPVKFFEHSGNPVYPDLHSVQFWPITFGLQKHCPFELQYDEVDPWT